MPIVTALRMKGYDAYVIFYSDNKAKELIDELNDAEAVVSRDNSDNIPGGQSNYFIFLNSLENEGILVLSSPKTMLTYGAKDAISKLAGTPMVPSDTYVYYTQDELIEKFSN